MNSAFVALALLASSAPQVTDAPDVSENVRKGLKWLAEQQKKDGSWAITNYDAPNRITTLAGLALLMEGSTLKEGTYAPNLRKALDWLEANAAATTILGKDRAATDTVTRDQAHAILFLVSLHETDDDRARMARIAKLLDKAIADAVKSQTARGGWDVLIGAKYTENLSEWTADILHALFAARRAGFKVPQKVTNAGLAYLVRATNRDGGVVASHSGSGVPRGNSHRMSTFNATAIALAADCERPAALPQWAKFTFPNSLQQMREIRTGGTQVMLHQFHAANACFLLGENGHRKIDPNLNEKELVKWSAYRVQLFKALKEAQANTGTWTDAGHGETYPTALALIILQLDNNYLSAFSR